MAKVEDLSGRTFGDLRVLPLYFRVLKGTQKRTEWLCRCECGQLSTAEAGHLKGGSTVSCGCVRASRLHETTHGNAGDPLYSTWKMMLRRCYNQKDKDYPRYGGRGITVCDRWHDLNLFIRDVGERPKGATLDRIDNDGPYGPANFRWATRVQQSNNTRTNRLLTYGGRTQSVSLWARETGVNRNALFDRIRKHGPSSEVVASLLKGGPNTQT